MQKDTLKLLIIGAGPAGLTAAIYAARADLEPVVIEGSKPGGQLMGTSIVENWPGERSIMGPALMMNMQKHALDLGTKMISESVVRVDFSKKPFEITTDREQILKAQSIIIATGASPNLLKVPGEEDYWGKGISTCAVCDGFFMKDKKVVVIGGGDTAMENASFLRKFTDQITIIQIKDTLSASFAMQQRVINDPAIQIIYSSSVTQFEGDGSKVTGVVVKNIKSGTETKIAADGAFIAIGLTPNTKPFADQIKLDTWGYISITDHTKTSVEGIFAAGDVKDFKYRQAITSAGDGCMAALDAERYLAHLKE